MNTPASSRPRVAPLRSHEWSPALRFLLSQTPGGTEQPLRIMTTLAKHPSVFWPWLVFAARLLTGNLPAKDRELVILRTAHLCQCAYEKRHHADLALDAGVTKDEVTAADRASLDAFEWPEDSRVLLAAVDEIHRTNTVSDATWTALSKIYDERQLIELVMLVGHYHMVAYSLNVLRVEVESDSHATVPSPRLRTMIDTVRKVFRS